MGNTIVMHRKPLHNGQFGTVNNYRDMFKEKGD